MKIIENPVGVASGKIYNIGNPAQQLFGARARADDARAGAEYPEYRDERRKR